MFQSPWIRFAQHDKMVLFGKVAKFQSPWIRFALSMSKFEISTEEALRFNPRG